jgi:flagellar hook assembly protein FlgD
LPRLRGHPNPFTAGTTLRFYVTGAATVRVEIFNVLGRRVRSLLDARRPVGWHTVHWDGRGDDGSRLAAGAYFARVAAGRQVVTRRLLLAR